MYSTLTISRNGPSQHGDYVFGWKGDALQRALDKRCSGDVCSVLKRQTPEEAMKCTKPQIFKEPVEGCESHLLGLVKNILTVKYQGLRVFPAWLRLLRLNYIVFVSRFVLGEGFHVAEAVRRRLIPIPISFRIRPS